jgi:FKBP-type peptidyl-prolyl cis-trans isomerase
MLAAALTLASCNNDSGVMREIERAEAEETASMEPPQTLPSGLVLQVRERGSDQSLPQPSLDATVLVHYEGSFAESGEVFDSSIQRGQPAEFPLRAVVRGFSEAITHMRPGDDVVATFPGELGYGAEGRPPRIPPNAALRFRIVLLAFQEPDGTMVQAPAPQ